MSKIISYISYNFMIQNYLYKLIPLHFNLRVTPTSTKTLIANNKWFILLIMFSLNINTTSFYFKNALSWALYKNKTKQIRKFVFNIAICFPYYKNQLDDKMKKIKQDLELSTLKLENGIIRQKTLPVIGANIPEIVKNIKQNANTDLAHYSKDMLSGTMYNTPDSKEIQMLKDVMDSYYKTNPLHSDIFPSLITMEKDIVSICKELLSLKNGGTGSLTTGGTESIILALFGYREFGKKRGITSPEVVALTTVHPAFDKGCYYLGIKLRKVAVDKNNNIDPIELSLALNHKTILIVGSVPSFPHGLIDDIELLSHMAEIKNIPLHLDACLGGFIFPFLDSYNELYNNLNLCDFRNPIVSSISIDTHKYGLCPKGSSVIIFRDKSRFENCYFIKSDWNGGIYATTNITGSRSGLNVAWTWSILNSNGQTEYFNNALKIINHLERIKQAFDKNGNVFIFGEPILSVVAFGSDTLDIYKISQGLKKKGWNLNELQNPPSFHLCITNCHTEDSITKFIRDMLLQINNVKELESLIQHEEQNNINLGAGDGINSEKEAINKQGQSNNQSQSKNQNTDSEGGSIYGTSQKVDDIRIIDSVVTCYLNTLH